MAFTTWAAGDVITAAKLNNDNSVSVGTDTARTVTVTHTYTASQTFTGGWTAAAACTVSTGGLTVTAGGLTITAGGATVSAGGATVTGNSTVAGTVIVTAASATALAVGRAGASNAAFLVDTSTASSANGVQIVAAAEGSGVGVAVISSGTNESLSINAKGSGTVTIGSSSTGGITLSRATTISAGGLTFTGGATIGQTGAASAFTTVACTGTITENRAADGTFFAGQVLSTNVWSLASSGDTTITVSALNGRNLTLSASGGLITLDGGIAITGAASSQSAGVLSIGNTTQTSVGAAGGASALPATPTGYIKAYIGSTQYVIPYYAQA